jgi:hypothetical protein
MAGRMSVFVWLEGSFASDQIERLPGTARLPISGLVASSLADTY